MRKENWLVYMICFLAVRVCMCPLFHDAIKVMLGSRKSCQRGSNSDVFFDEGKEDPNTTKIGPSLASQRNDIIMAFCWRAKAGPTLNVGLVALYFFRGSGPVLLGNPIFLRFFRGGGVQTTCPPSGSAHEGNMG